MPTAGQTPGDEENGGWAGFEAVSPFAYTPWGLALSYIAEELGEEGVLGPLIDPIQETTEKLGTAAILAGAAALTVVVLGGLTIGLVAWKLS